PTLRRKPREVVTATRGREPGAGGDDPLAETEKRLSSSIARLSQSVYGAIKDEQVCQFAAD
ncbi:unnamed protein product, partial [Nippostrongylus brasiliensis]|uniref:Histone H3 n=1 Tax=Nippostrongylus brasiliensis TaxID=27835 RepID=A0A0N4YRD0_NIPBR